MFFFLACIVNIMCVGQSREPSTPNIVAGVAIIQAIFIYGIWNWI